MIDILKNSKKNSWPYYYLVIDGEVVPPKSDEHIGVRYWVWSTTYTGPEEEKPHKDLAIYDRKLSSEVLKLTAYQLQDSGFCKCSLVYPTSVRLFNGIPTPHGSDRKRDEIKYLWNRGLQTHPYCYFFFDFDFQNWAKPYSYQTYKEYLIKETGKLVKQGSVYFSSTINRSNDTVRFILEKDLCLQVQIERAATILKKANRKAITNLEKDHSKISLREFDFPPAVRTSCEQYLMYFADFLNEIGVSAVANIEHDKNGRTLFNIKPESSTIALDAIREALEIYLELPMSPLVDEPTSDTRMLVIQAEINSLRMRLNFAEVRELEQQKRSDLQTELIEAQKETIRSKDGQIGMLSSSANSNFQPSIVARSAIEAGYVDAEIVEEMTSSKDPISNKEMDLGLVTVKPAKIGLGVEANTPRLARLGIKTGKGIFDYLHQRFNVEKESERK